MAAGWQREFSKICYLCFHSFYLHEFLPLAILNCKNNLFHIIIILMIMLVVFLVRSSGKTISLKMVSGVSKSSWSLIMILTGPE